MDALGEFERGSWGQRYPTIAALWRRAWDRVIPFFAFAPAVRRVIYNDERHRERACAASQDHQES